ncbi:MAG: response regulator [Deltaproteobacteria bacterium]|nr:response regulator [Deltaproteobacteria bacterium]
MKTRRGILVVDDDDSVLMMISDWLTRHGYRVFAAGDVSTALKTYAENRDEVDLLMTDIKLRFETGFDLADALEQQYGFRRHVFFTSFIWEEEVAEALVSRGKPYFEKPLKFRKEILPFLETFFSEHPHES